MISAQINLNITVAISHKPLNEARL